MVTFNFTYDPGVTVQQALGFEIAGRVWSNYLADPVTLNIHVGVSSGLPANVIGGALPGMISNTSIGDFTNSLWNDRTSADDQRAPTNDTLQADMDAYVNGVYQPVSAGTMTFSTTRASSKAVGRLSGANASLDGAIVMGTLANSQFHWNYDYTRSSAPSSNSLDFLSVALHEIGHILGFVSGVDKQDLLSTSVSSSSQLDAYRDYARSRIRFSTPLDLFRTNTSGVRNLTYGSRGGARGFTLPGNTSLIAEFATGKNTSFLGDGYQASHWKEQANTLGIMDPAVAPQERVSISNLDLRAFDAIGWNLRNGLSASTFTSSFLSNFRTQAVQSLAQRLGQTTTWVNSNLMASPASMVRDRTTDVEAMIQASQILEWGTAGSGTTSNSGRRWMEIFNQMASNQRVYVNFSTVSTMMPAAPELDVSGLDWGYSGSGKITPSGRVWAEAPTDDTESPIDEILGVDATIPFVSFDPSDSLNLSGAVDNAIAETPSTTFKLAGTAWVPVTVQMTEGTVAGEPTPVTGTGLRQPFSMPLSTGLNPLLGTENNPLAQSSLSAGLGGAIA